MSATANMYQVREFVGTAYSVVLGRKLRGYQTAARICRRLRASGREVFIAKLQIARRCGAAA